MTVVLPSILLVCFLFPSFVLWAHVSFTNRSNFSNLGGKEQSIAMIAMLHSNPSAIRCTTHIAGRIHCAQQLTNFSLASLFIPWCQVPWGLLINLVLIFLFLETIRVQLELLSELSSSSLTTSSNLGDRWEQVLVAPYCGTGITTVCSANCTVALCIPTSSVF